jgi:hypothetical protein
MLKARVWYSDRIYIGTWAGAAMIVGFLFQLIEFVTAMGEKSRSKQGYTPVQSGTATAVANANRALEEALIGNIVSGRMQYYTSRLTLADVCNTFTYWLIFWCLAMSAGWTDGWFLLFAAGCIAGSCVIQVLLRIVGRTMQLRQDGKNYVPVTGNQETRMVNNQIVFDNQYRFSGLLVGCIVVLCLTFLPLYGLWMSYQENQQVSGWTYNRGNVLLSALSLFTGFVSWTTLVNVGDAMYYGPKIWMDMDMGLVKILMGIPMLIFVPISYIGRIAREHWMLPWMNIFSNGTMLFAIPIMLWKVVWSLWPSMAIPDTT